MPVVVITVATLTVPVEMIVWTVDAPVVVRVDVAVVVDAGPGTVDVAVAVVVVGPGPRATENMKPGALVTLPVDFRTPAVIGSSAGRTIWVFPVESVPTIA